MGRQDDLHTLPSCKGSTNCLIIHQAMRTSPVSSSRNSQGKHKKRQSSHTAKRPPSSRFSNKSEFPQLFSCVTSAPGAVSTGGAPRDPNPGDRGALRARVCRDRHTELPHGSPGLHDVPFPRKKRESPPRPQRKRLNAEGPGEPPAAGPGPPLPAPRC